MASPGIDSSDRPTPCRENESTCSSVERVPALLPTSSVSSRLQMRVGLIKPSNRSTAHRRERSECLVAGPPSPRDRGNEKGPDLAPVPAFERSPSRRISGPRGRENPAGSRAEAEVGGEGEGIHRGRDPQPRHRSLPITVHRLGSPDQDVASIPFHSKRTLLIRIVEGKELIT